MGSTAPGKSRCSSTVSSVPSGQQATQPAGLGLVALAAEAVGVRREAGKLQHPDRAVRPHRDVDGHVQAVDDGALVALRCRWPPVARRRPDRGSHRSALRSIRRRSRAMPVGTASMGSAGCAGLGSRSKRWKKRVVPSGFAVATPLPLASDTTGTPCGIEGHVEGVDEHDVVEPLHGRAQLVRRQRHGRAKRCRCAALRASGGRSTDGPGRSCPRRAWRRRVRASPAAHRPGRPNPGCWAGRR